jgi:hypothetical protein
MSAILSIFQPIIITVLDVTYGDSSAKDVLDTERTAKDVLDTERPFAAESPFCNTVSPGGGSPKHFPASITNKL